MKGTGYSLLIQQLETNYFHLLHTFDFWPSQKGLQIFDMPFMSLNSQLLLHLSLQSSKVAELFPNLVAKGVASYFKNNILKFYCY